MNAHLPDAFFESVVSLLPPQAKPGRQGGRPAIPQVVVLRVIWFVLTVGCRWNDIPSEFACSGETARRRLKLWQELGVWERAHHRLLSLLRQRGCFSGRGVLIDSTHIRAFGGGDRSGPSPVDRRKPGTKLTLLTDLGGIPLTLRSASANTSDHLKSCPRSPRTPRSVASQDDHVADRDWSLPMPGTTVRPHGKRCLHKESSLRSATGTTHTVRDWGVFAGRSNARSAGSRGCVGCGFATIDIPPLSTPGSTSHSQ